MKTLLSFLLFLMFFQVTILQAQSEKSDTFNSRWLLDLPLIDLAYLSHAAETAAYKRLGYAADGSIQPKPGDYFRSYESLSMQQALAVTKDLHGTNYYLQNRLWDHLIRPDNRSKKLFNRIAAHATAGAIDYALAYQGMVFSPVWLHEEFHRNGLCLHGIASHNDTYYKLNGKGAAGGSISKVTDEDLVRLKATAPTDMVRSFAAGVESQYLLLRHMQQDNFFSRTRYPNIVMNILLTKEAVSYVNQFKRSDYDAGIDSMNVHGQIIADRDYVGWDFTAWVYDMFRPDEAYTARGTHPLGNGIDRIIKRTDLSAEEDAYLVKMGKLQHLNFISPFLLGINRISLGANSSFNFAMRHYLTSFGYNLNLDIFLDHHQQNWLLGLHTYHNQEKVFTGIELQRKAVPIQLGSRQLLADAGVMLWVQPEGESFYAEKGKAGGLLQFRGRYPLSRHLSAYLEVEGKTDGWVAGNPYLDANINLRTGLFLDIRK